MKWTRILVVALIATPAIAGQQPVPSVVEVVEAIAQRGSAAECPRLDPYLEGRFEYRFVSAPFNETVPLAAVLHSGGYYVSGPVVLDRGYRPKCYAFYYQTNRPPHGEKEETP